jgi:hypothetical protein
VEKTHACGILVRKAKGKELLGKNVSRWEDNIKVDFEDIGWDVMDLINLAQE